MLEQELGALAERQHGLLTRDDLLRSVSRRQIEYRVGRELLVVQPNVYRLAGAPITFELRVLAAVLAAGPGAFASWRTAAALSELDGFPRQPVEVTTAPRRRVRLAGVTVHETRFTGSRHLDLVRGIPVSSAARTICDLSAAIPLGRVARVLDECLRRQLTTLHKVRAVHLDLQHRGRRRSTIIRTLLEERLGGLEPGGSAPEVRLVRMLVAAGLPAPVQQHEIRVGGMRFLVDLAYPDRRIAIEYDGWDFHSTRTAFDADRSRANLIVADGWTLLRFTSKSTRAEIVGAVRQAFDRQSLRMRSTG